MEFTEEAIVLMMLGALLGVCIISRALDGAGLLAASVIGSIIGFLDIGPGFTAHLFLLSASIATRWRYEEKKRLALQKLTTAQEDGKTLWQTAGLRPSQSSSMMQWGAQDGGPLHCPVVLQ
ncbi:MAG: hypothetical protein CM15mP82_8180 [Methanobacteriota archaeon]|nr:MAG: hypothetical protein CM15mP82_8180 [Euryarchaeota archaeon]